jgi:hypothetical protein
MPVFLDVHTKVDGATKGAVAEAPERDLAVQGRCAVSFSKYWLYQ